MQTFDPSIVPTFEKIRHLKRLSEDDFRDQVVRPIFLRMGMEHGSDTCGTTEAGKDCYFWTHDNLGFRMLYVVQTKAGNITMSRDPSASLQEAITQLRTAMAATVPDIVTKKRTKPNVGIFCVSGKINEHARQHIIDEVREPNLRFLDADELIPQIDTLYPEFWQGIEVERYPYLNAFRERLLDGSDVISLATILPDAKVSAAITSEGFAALRLMRTYLKPQKSNGRIEQIPDIELISVQSLFHRTDSRVLILGEAGDGKSTILRRLAMILIERASDTGNKLLIPVLLRAIDIARASGTLAEIAMCETMEVTKSKSPGFGVDQLQAGQVALLVDALDEVASEERSRLVLGKIEDFLQKYPLCKIVLTSRQQNYLSNLEHLIPYSVFRIAPLELKEASLIIRNASRNNTISQELSREIVRQLENVHGMEINPLLITVFVASSDSTRKDIPANITEMFAKFTEMMLGRWDTRKGLAQQHEAGMKDLLLQKFAYELHLNRRTAFTKEEASQAFRDELIKLGRKDSKVESMVEEILVRSGLFRIMNGRYEFRHLLLQEFFAGRGIPSKERVLSLLGDEWWRRSIVFYFGGNPKDSEGLLYLATSFETVNPTERFIAAVTLGLASQACYFVKVPDKVDVLNWVISALASAQEESIAVSNKEGSNIPLHNFIYHYLAGRDCVAAEALNNVDSFTSLWKGAGSSHEKSLRLFWIIAGLIENGEMESVRGLLKHFDPADKQLFLAIHLGCFMVEQQRIVSADTKRDARRIITELTPITAKFRQQLLKELKSELLSIRQGKMIALDVAKPDASI